MAPWSQRWGPFVLVDAILTPIREPPLLSSQVQQGLGHLRAIPQQDFGPPARAARKHVEITGKEILSEGVRHERAESIKPFPHIDGRAVGVDGNLACGADHARFRSAVTTPARWPW